MTSLIWASRLPHSPHADRERKMGGTEEKQKEGRKEKKRQWRECLMGLHVLFFRFSLV